MMRLSSAKTSHRHPHLQIKKDISHTGREAYHHTCIVVSAANTLELNKQCRPYPIIIILLYDVTENRRQHHVYVILTHDDVANASADR